MSSLRGVWTDNAYHCPRNYASHLPNTCLIRPVICIQDVDATCLRHQKSGILYSFHVKCQRHILGIRWYDHICNTEIAESTGLPPLMDLIIRRRNSLPGHIAVLGRTSQHIKLFSARSTSLLDVFMIALENVLHVSQEASGWLRFTLTTNLKFLSPLTAKI